EPTRDDLPQPQALSRDRQVHARSEPRLDLLELRPHAVASALALQGEAALARFAADEGEAEKIEGFRFAQPLLLAVGRREAAERDEPGLVRMKRERECRQPFAHRLEESASVGLAFETDDVVVGIAHDDHVARGFAPSPALGPE